MHFHEEMELGHHNSPKSSPRGSRSPACPRQDSTGSLKMSITLGKNPAIVHTGPFYLMKEQPEPSEITGNTNLMSYHGLEHSYNKFSGKKMKEELSTFLPNLPGNIDNPPLQDNFSSLRSLIEKPPITGKELTPLTGAALAGFRLHPGPLPEQYRLLTHVVPVKRKKHKKHKKEGKDSMLNENTGGDNAGEVPYKKKKKEKNKDDNKKKDKTKKKKKKEKDKEEKVPVPSS